MITQISGIDIAAKIDSYVKPDGWRFGARLIAGDSFSALRIPVDNGGPITSLAIRIEITGRTFKRIGGALTVRARIIFPGDGEPDTVTGGYLQID